MRESYLTTKADMDHKVAWRQKPQLKTGRNREPKDKKDE
jgi:hypothetical protein